MPTSSGPHNHRLVLLGAAGVLLLPALPAAAAEAAAWRWRQPISRLCACHTHASSQLNSARADVCWIVSTCCVAHRT